MINYRKLTKKYLNKSADNSAQMITALAVGLVAGAVISILFAPKKGLETRKHLADRSRKFYGSIKDKLGVACDQLTEDIKISAKTESPTKRKVNSLKKKATVAKKKLDS